MHGEGTDQPLVQFEGSGVADSARRYLYSDERGSVVAVTDSAGNVLNRTGYDEYGFYTDSNASYATRFKYTGQAYVPELGLSYYKARMYSPRLGRFMQTDPIGYEGGMNLYAYVLGDPINNRDPLGLEDDAIVITAKKRRPRVIINLQKPEQSTSSSGGRSGREGRDSVIVVAGKKPQKEQTNSCGAALQEPGEIGITSSTIEAYLVFGLTYSMGEFVNKTTGTYGQFKTFGLGVGFGGGATGGGGRYRSLSDFVGMGEGAGASVSVGPVSAGGWRSYSITSGDRVGSGGGLGYSAPGPAIRNIGAAVASTLTETTISDCHYRPK